MTGIIREESKENYGIFRECVSKSILNRSMEKSGVARRRRNRKRNASARFSKASFPDDNDPAELAEFIDVCCPTDPRTSLNILRYSDS